MEITQTNRTGVTVISPSVRIKYTIPSKADGTVEKLSGTIFRNEQIVGYFNADHTGVTGLSVHEKDALTPAELKNVFTAAIDDATTIFGTGVPVEEENLAQAPVPEPTPTPEDPGLVEFEPVETPQTEEEVL
jgi:hypothetical protein